LCEIAQKLHHYGMPAEEVFNMLKAVGVQAQEPVSDRIYRSIVFLSQGNMNKLNHYIELSLTDCRDLVWQAEYEDPEKQKYDFNKSFHELGLL
jgi:hypothetical protein